MKGVVAAIVVCAWAIPVTAQVAGVAPTGGISFQIPARDPRPPAPSPVTPINPAPPSRPPALFRAAPDAYAPRYDRPVPVPLIPYAVGGDTLPQERIIERTSIVVLPASTFAADVASTVAADAAMVGKPTTLYLIPGCYAGDTPPRAERLPAGCPIGALRIIQPR